MGRAVMSTIFLLLPLSRLDSISPETRQYLSLRWAILMLMGRPYHPIVEAQRLKCNDVLAKSRRPLMILRYQAFK